MAAVNTWSLDTPGDGVRYSDDRYLGGPPQLRSSVLVYGATSCGLVLRLYCCPRLLPPSYLAALSAAAVASRLPARLTPPLWLPQVTRSSISKIDAASLREQRRHSRLATETLDITAASAHPSFTPSSSPCRPQSSMPHRSHRHANGPATWPPGLSRLGRRIARHATCPPSGGSYNGKERWASLKTDSPRCSGATP